jgi:glycine/D-amino acid oxidase-like deaminating enzyme
MDACGIRVGVIGASIAGLSVANALARIGAEVTVFERGMAASNRAATAWGSTPAWREPSRPKRRRRAFLPGLDRADDRHRPGGHVCADGTAKLTCLRATVSPGA